ncbi:cytochrome P450 [Fistulina hepatica ATCC 64428]|uniref:Cytochrome P450 n=1 Tax=Fistulina hepatica ATCC 64428 TaxID=1128425 RepID=A0A0D7A5Y3_9AGAR|nr:cytochrome P450 [Fistulina hepatica ATCC 64428]
MFPTIHISISLAACVSFLVFILIRAIYQLFFSPLSAIPGPWYAAISDFWITTHVLRLQQCKVIQSLFEKYGPVVRIGPNKVVFCDLATSRSVYTLHKFDKSVYYKSLLTDNNDHAMSTLEHAPHAMRRKGYAPHYTPTNLAQFQPEMHDFVRELVHILNNVSSKSSVDCLTLFRHLMVDVVVASSHGCRLGAVGKWSMGVNDSLSVAISDFPKRGIIRSTIPTWAWNLVCKIPNARWKLLCDSDKIMAEFVSARVYEMRALQNAGKLGESEKMPMLQRLLNYRYSSTGELMPDADVISEAMGHMIAGADTSSTTLSYWFWELSRRPDIVKRLRAEVDEVMHDTMMIPDISVLMKLPYFNAFVKEGLRIYGSAPSLLERVVPGSTSMNGVPEGFDLLGFALPPGTIVSTQAWSMHRDPSVFPSPETFLPDRWLDAPAEQLQLMNQYMMPFGIGTRTCGGQNLAQVMLRVVLVAVVRNFDIEAPVETNERSMEMRDSFVIFPASMACNLIFHPRKL